jgi:hypothetical protein
MHLFAKASFVTIFAFAGVAAQGTNVISNGNFGTGTLVDWTAVTTANGTNGAGFPAVASFNTTGTGASDSAEFDVGEVSVSGAPEGGGITQMFTLGSGGAFTFSANIASQDDADMNLNTDAGTYSILIDGTTLASDSLGAFSSPLQITRGTLSGSVNLTGGTHTFEVLITRDFTANGTDTPNEYVTNIALNGSTTPEPATFALAALGLIGLALCRKRSFRGND